jgi:subtilase family protein
VFEEARRPVDTVNQMTRMHSFPARGGGLSIALAVIALVALPSSSLAMHGLGGLAPRLAKLASPALRGAPPAQQARALGLSAHGLARRGPRVLVDVRFRAGALAARDELRTVGGSTVAASGRYQTVTVSALPAHLRTIARVPGVESVTLVLAPVAAAAKCPSGAVVSEGDAQLQAKAARDANPGVNGTGITVGILSDSFDQASESEEGGPIATKANDDVKSGDLPGANGCLEASTTPVETLPGEEGPTNGADEGRAMAQIVHDLAPGATLKFATAFTSDEISFANNIRALAAAGAKVIVDDVFWQGEPFFQDGPIAVAVNEVVEDGVAYFSAAGNDNLVDKEGHDIASWETPEYRDAGSCPPGVQAVPGANAFHCLDFNPGPAVDRTFGIKVEGGETLAVDLQWDEPWFGVGTDLDAFLLNSTGGLIAESAEDNLDGTPVEVLEWTNASSSTKTVQLAVNRFFGSSPRLKFALLENGRGVSATEYPRSSGEDVVGPTIFGHSGAASAISVAAVSSTTKSLPERYSSRGPVRHDFGPVVDDTAAAQLESPETLSKPDLTATDCVRTTFFSFFDDEEVFPTPGWYFCGTSAAAPHAAAVAALMRQAAPASGPEEIREALVGSAVSTFNLQYGPCDVGAGLIDAVGAIEKALAKTGASGPVCEPPEEEVPPAEAAASGEWGSEVPQQPSGRSTTPTVTAPPVVEEEEEAKREPSPRTFFLQRPSKIIGTRHHQARAIFRFGSNESDASFVCRVDGSFFRPCPARLVRQFTLGWHVVKVAARNSAGDGDKTPASYSFKVKRVR